MSTIQTRQSMDSADIARIARSRERELLGWAKVMGTSTARLERAVQAVGIAPRRVRSYLREHP